MRTLSEITAAIRSGTEFTEGEARYAVVAYDVMVAHMQPENNPTQLAIYFQASDRSPVEFIGWSNDPENPDAVTWYRAMNGVGA